MKWIKNLLRIFAFLVAFCCNHCSTKELTVSVIIPCVPQHATHLRNLLSHYACQTELPKEIIVSFSQANLISKECLDQLENIDWPFKLILLRNRRRVTAGGNRCLGSRVAQGDILMFQDADDIPHPQRIEIVRYFFDQYDIYHLMHCYVLAEKLENNGEIPAEFVHYQKDKVPFLFGAAYSNQGEGLFPITNGHPCVLRFLAREIMWPDVLTTGEDIRYNRMIYDKYPNKTLIIQVPLVLYRNRLSSGSFTR